RRVDAAVVQRRQDDALARDLERCGAQLVEDLAGLLGGVDVVRGALQPGKDPQGRRRDAHVEREREPGGPDRVPAEEREEPGRAGGEEVVPWVVGEGQTQGVEVAERGV